MTPFLKPLSNNKYQITISDVVIQNKLKTLNFVWEKEEVNTFWKAFWAAELIKALAKNPETDPKTFMPVPTDDSEVKKTAMDLAKKLIEHELGKQGLPVPKSLDLHAEKLIQTNPHILERARLELEARLEVLSEILPRSANLPSLDEI